MSDISVLQHERLKYQPKTPEVFKNGLKKLQCSDLSASTSVADQDKLTEIFKETYGQNFIDIISSENDASTEKLKVGVVLSGGPAAGGHNVIIGLFDGLKQFNQDNELIGFIQGPGGIVDNQYKEITSELVDTYRNTGGFDMIQSGRTKIETPEQFDACLKNCTDLGLDALLVIGGDDSNTNAALLAEFFKSKQAKTRVLGAPKTIDGDLKNEYIEASFGFDTACKVYAELVGNICRDAISSAKYWHFIKLMGRSASHIALEVGLQTQINKVLIGEEVEANKQTLKSIVDDLASMILARSNNGQNYGVVLIPEGIIEFIPEMGDLISTLNDLLAHETETNAIKLIELALGKLSSEQGELLKSLPTNIQSQLVAERDPHGNVQVSLIETEKLLAEMVSTRMSELKEKGEFKAKFGALTHFFGYEGRCAFPSNFDTDYTYGLGQVASILINSGKTGYIASLCDLNLSVSEWKPKGIPLTSMMNIERRHGKDKPVIKKALVELDGKPLKYYQSKREAWSIDDHYTFPGPVQFYGPTEICDIKSKSLILEKTK